MVLHDRAVRGRRTNLDHIVVVPSGVWVVDSKHYRGALERRTPSGASSRGPASSWLVATGPRWRRRRAASRRWWPRHWAPAPLVRAALCFTGVERALFTRPFIVQGVLVTWPKALARTLGAPGRLGLAERRALADRLARGLPALIRVDYAPGGTSHSPTGASPRR